MSSSWFIKGFVLSLLLPGAVGAQFYYFGKNKVQYKGFDFARYETPHFQIYFYSGGEPLAEFAGQVCEAHWARLKEEMGLAPGETGSKIPLIIYNSPLEFAQTNVILEIIEESVGGFAELFKNRMVVPFTGSYSELRHVLEHELTHIFQFQLFYKDRLASLLTLIPTFRVPLWVMEGMAEFCSRGWDAEADGFMRDLVINNRLVPIQQLSDDKGYLLYRVGHAIFHFIAERYGRPKVFQFVHSLKLHRSLSRAFKDVFGLSIEEFDEAWQDFFRLRYWPLIGKKGNFALIARRLTGHEGGGSSYNSSPVISGSGTKVAFVSDRAGYAEVYVVSAIDGKLLKRLLRSDRLLGHEGIPLMRPGLAWAPDERSLAVVGQTGGRNILMLVEYPSGRIRRRLSPNLCGLYAPAFSPDGERVVFVGLKAGQSDIYSWDLGQNTLQRITHDLYEERDPSFTPDGGILFVSDRPEDGVWRPGLYRIFKYSADLVEPLTPPLGYCGSPTLSPDGKDLYFVAGERSRQIYCFSLETGRIRGHSQFLGEVRGLSLCRDGRRLAFTYYWEGSWNVSILEEPQEKLTAQPDQEEFARPEDYPSYDLSGLDRGELEAYSLSFSPDYAIGMIGYSTGYGISGDLRVAVSDILGDHRIYLAAELWRDLAHSDMLFEYWWLPRRLDIGLFLGQEFDFYWLGGPDYLIKTTRGGGWLFSYPLNKFLRLEGGPVGLWVDKRWLKEWGGDFYLIGRDKRLVGLMEGAVVVDNTLWEPTGPVRGRRARLAGYYLFSGYRLYTGWLDYRRYHPLSPQYILAGRALVIASGGKDRERYYLGGRTVRGYGDFEAKGSRLGVLNLELRFPFIDRIEFGFPCRWRVTRLRGVGFVDMGCAWDEEFEPIDLNRRVLKDLKLGVGAGLRFQVFYLPVKLDLAKPLSVTEDKGWKLYIGVGPDF